MAHTVNATTLRYEHMSPTAAGMAATLHVVAAVLLLWATPLKNFEVPEQAIEVTMEEPPPKSEPPTAPTPSPPPAQATPNPPAQATAPPPSRSQLGVSPPTDKSTPDKSTPEAKPNIGQGVPPPPPEPAKQEPEQQAAAQSPPSAPKPDMEKALPAVEMPTPPLSMQDFVRAAPPPPPQEIVRPPPHVQPAPPAAPTVQQQRPPQLAPSPLGHAPQHQQQQRAPTDSQASVALVNPSVAATRARATDEYVWAVIRKFSQYLPDLREKNQGGTVVVRIVIARDGRVLEAGLAKPSGVAALDKGMLEAIRVAGPYPPLPPELPGDNFVFIQPITAKR